MKVDYDKEPYLFEEFKAEDLEHVIETQRKIWKYSKETD